MNFFKLGVDVLSTSGIYVLIFLALVFLIKIGLVIKKKFDSKKLGR